MDFTPTFNPALQPQVTRTLRVPSTAPLDPPTLKMAIDTLKDKIGDAFVDVKATKTHGNLGRSFSGNGQKVDIDTWDIHIGAAGAKADFAGDPLAHFDTVCTEWSETIAQLSQPARPSAFR